MMKEATKKQMVDFINSRCRIKGKKIPKTKLNQLAEEDLLKIIKAQPEIESAFTLYLESENVGEKKSPDAFKEEAKEGTFSQNTHAESGTASEELTRELEHLVDQLAKDPTSFLAITELRSFIGNLPYGSVSFETLSALIDKVMEVDPATAFLLLKYSTDQELDRQKKKK